MQLFHAKINGTLKPLSYQPSENFSLFLGPRPYLPGPLAFTLNHEVATTRLNGEVRTLGIRNNFLGFGKNVEPLKVQLVGKLHKVAGLRAYACGTTQRSFPEFIMVKSAETDDFVCSPTEIHLLNVTREKHVPVAKSGKRRRLARIRYRLAYSCGKEGFLTTPAVLL